MTTWVLLRGWAREARHWGPFADALRESVPAGDAVIAIDMPGNGRRCGQRSPWSVPAFLDAVRGELRAGGVGGRVVPVGLSMGGMVAMQWAAAWPQELAGCVLVNTSARGVAPAWQRLQPSSYAALFAVAMPWLTAADRERRILALTSNLHADDAAVAAQWTAYARDKPVTAMNALRQLAAAASFQVPLARPRAPVLIVASRRDRLVSPCCSQQLAQRFGVPLRMHEAAGHDLPLDAPEWLADEISLWWSHALRLHLAA